MVNEPYFHDESVTLWHGDSLEVLRELESGSVDCCVTSPPYFNLRDYDVAPTDWPNVSYTPLVGVPPITVPATTCCLGDESDPLAFVAHLYLIFSEVRRVLTDDGTLWLNLGDSYSSAGGQMGGKHHYIGGKRLARSSAGMPAKNLLNIPGRTSLALQADGWFFRSDVIWAKPNPMPEPVTSRPTSSHEHVLLFSKSKSYYYNAAAIAETATGQASGNGFERSAQISRGVGQRESWQGRPQLRRALQLATEKGLTERHFAAIRAIGMNDAGKAKVNQSGNGKNTAEMQALANEAKAALGGYYREFLTGATKNARDVWTIPVVGFPEAHFAVMSPEVADRCVLAGCKPGGVVLDPFSGVGTTGMVAANHGNKYVGIDLGGDALDLSLRTRLGQTALLDGESA